eukprot:357057-Chlamydomonas_euryale.AAC.1
MGRHRCRERTYCPGRAPGGGGFQRSVEWCAAWCGVWCDVMRDVVRCGVGVGGLEWAGNSAWSGARNSARNSAWSGAGNSAWSRAGNSAWSGAGNSACGKESGEAVDCGKERV